MILWAVRWYLMFPISYRSRPHTSSVSDSSATFRLDRDRPGVAEPQVGGLRQARGRGGAAHRMGAALGQYGDVAGLERDRRHARALDVAAATGDQVERHPTISKLMLLDRGVEVDHTTIFRWIQAYAAELEKRIRPHLRTSNGSWRVDETYVRVKGRWTYLYRAVASCWPNDRLPALGEARCWGGEAVLPARRYPLATR